MIDPLIERNNGRIVKLMGDGILIEFASIVDAVTCAVAVQVKILDAEKNRSVDQKIQFRIGINLGDIIVQDDDILGDGVNIAARLEQKAEPGGICLSGTAFDHLKSKVDVGYEPLGDIEVKNIATPIRAYRVVYDGDPNASLAPPANSKRLMFRGAAALVALVLIASAGWWWSQQPEFEPVAPASMAMALPSGASIAVLPFDYLGADPDQNGILADGLTENITAYLANIPDLLVIARNSASVYKGKAVDVRKVSQRFPPAQPEVNVQHELMLYACYRA